MTPPILDVPLSSQNAVAPEREFYKFALRMTSWRPVRTPGTAGFVLVRERPAAATACFLITLEDGTGGRTRG